MGLLTLLLSTTIVIAVDPRDVERLVSHHEETLARIRTLRGVVESRQRDDRGKTWKVIEAVSIIRDGRRELVRDRVFGSYYGGVWQEGESITTTLLDDAECRMLSGCEPGEPPHVPLAEDDLDTVRWAFIVHPAYGPQGWNNRWKMQFLLMIGEDSLRDLVRKSTVESLERRPGPGGGSIWRLTLNPRRPGVIRQFALTLPSQYGYLISQQETIAVEEGKTYTGRREVVEFHDLGSGLFLPRRIRSTASNSPEAVYEAELKDVQVNQPIERDLALPFPEGAIVIDQRSQKYHLWGKDSPARTFASQDEFNAWNTERSRRRFSASRKRRDFPAVPLGLLALMGVGLFGLLYYRRRVRRALA